MKKVVIDYKELTKKEKIFYWIRKAISGTIYFAILIVLTFSFVYSAMHNSSNASITASAEVSYSTSDSSDAKYSSGLNLYTSDGVYSFEDNIVGWFSIEEINETHISLNYSCYYNSVYNDTWSSYLSYLNKYIDFGTFSFEDDIRSEVIGSYTYYFLSSPSLFVEVDGEKYSVYFLYCPNSYILSSIGYDSYIDYAEDGNPTIYDCLTVTYQTINGYAIFNFDFDVSLLSGVEWHPGSMSITSTYYMPLIYIDGYSGTVSFSSLSNTIVSSSTVFSFAPGYWGSGYLTFNFDNESDIARAYQSGYESGYLYGSIDGYKEGNSDSESYYESGYSDGEEAGYASGYSDGEEAGYNSGYAAGEAYGAGTSWANPVVTLLGGVSYILSVNIFGYFSLATFVEIGLYIFIALMVIKLFT